VSALLAAIAINIPHINPQTNIWAKIKPEIKTAMLQIRSEKLFLSQIADKLNR